MRMLNESRAALTRGDFDFFADRLPQNQHYRIALADPHSTVFLDIEATGLSLFYDHTTVIGAADVDDYYLYIKGGELKRIEERLCDAKCIVTFNGTAFDLKFLRKEYPQIRLPRAHVDLRFFGLPFGLRGSQKYIEEAIGFSRPHEVRSIRGEKAPLLWYRYSRGDLDAGRQLVEYNHSDIEGMKLIFDTIVGKILGAEQALSKFYRGYRFFHREPEWRADYGHTRYTIVVPPFRGKTGPQVTYDQLIAGERPKTLRIVGIDLTGSEERATGWCLLTGNRATTMLLHADKELIEQTVRSKPDIVSIDSPLSLPKGRKRVSDDDPGRAKFGIMRECERTLKRRGVNVYPCLINSMQNMTARGIRLAKKLRSKGIPVIESYPGAAQDIMGIPRKRASLAFLKEGLRDFGILGDFNETKVTHDEVDAITSAVVALFFWSGKFEALGNDDEEYLIVPDLLVNPDQWRQRLALGISGPIAAGKTTGAKLLEQQGLSYGRYSQVLANMLAKRNIPVTRITLQKIGETVHKKPGQRWLSRQLISQLARDRNIVIDGLRFPEDHAFLVESFGPAFFHIHVSAAENVRKDRYILDGNTAAAFGRAAHHAVEARIPRLAAIAHQHIVNEGSKSAYERELLCAIPQRGPTTSSALQEHPREHETHS